MEEDRAREREATEQHGVGNFSQKNNFLWDINFHSFLLHILRETEHHSLFSCSHRTLLQISFDNILFHFHGRGR